MPRRMRRANFPIRIQSIELFAAAPKKKEFFPWRFSVRLRWSIALEETNASRRLSLAPIHRHCQHPRHRRHHQHQHLILRKLINHPQRLIGKADSVPSIDSGNNLNRSFLNYGGRSNYSFKLLRKSTLINTIFASHLIDSKGRIEADEIVRQTTEIQAVSHIVVENNVKLRLNIVDTPGYGDMVNNDACWEPIIKYIKDQHSAYLRKELTAMRDRFIQDTRIHCCLYFIAPTGHGLRPIDVIVMKKLSEVVNVVPVIAKSDSLTLDEREAFKVRIRDELHYHNIRLYPFDSDDHDSEEMQLNEAIRNMIPFAVVGSERNVIIDGKPVRGRKNRWGVINVENEEHCEFNYLRNFLTRTHLQDLIETTAQIHYEAFRSKQLLALKESSATKAQHPATQPNGA
ncbi:hypothetical protein O181_045809 [Austropuccinia psidii MF-1]|uniref:Septin-type G domain-containing protein n=1 Tax=Austropuccinia psidii MF-1 TaxID=1389203 RepID=A0A9Q3HKP6_9BASI|nr:hypothetical protein [Austropuccinia psidii MF-1]